MLYYCSHLECVKFKRRNKQFTFLTKLDLKDMINKNYRKV